MVFTLACGCAESGKLQHGAPAMIMRHPRTLVKVVGFVNPVFLKTYKENSTQ